MTITKFYFKLYAYYYMLKIYYLGFFKAYGSWVWVKTSKFNAGKFLWILENHKLFLGITFKKWFGNYEVSLWIKQALKTTTEC